jgi:Zn-dependent metalloprotease
VYQIPSTYPVSAVLALDIEPDVATVNTALNGQQVIPVSKLLYQYDPTTHALVTRETIERDGHYLNKSIQTLDFANTTILASAEASDTLAGYLEAKPFESVNNTWHWDPDTRAGQIAGRALDIHYGANQTLDYYFDQFNRNGVDGNGELNLLNAVAPIRIDSNIEVEDGHNAWWSKIQFSYRGNVYGMMTYLDGVGRRGGNGNIGVPAAIDILGHELTHGVTQFTANFEYAGESGALDEGISDIFGTLVKVYSKDKGFQSNDWSWIMGDGSFPIRDMKSPKNYDQPSTYLGENWSNTYLAGVDLGGVHINSGVLNHWFVIASEGAKDGGAGSGVNDNGYAYNVKSVGLSKMQGVVYRALTVYLGPNSDYSDAREATLKAANDLTRKSVSDVYPGVPRLTNQDVQQIAKAWDAVGVDGGLKPSALTTIQSNSESKDFSGTSGNEEFLGSASDNIAKGRAGYDLLYGFDGNDRLNGGYGNDKLDGGNDDDVLIGGKGRDVFIVSQGNDRILDFDADKDRLVWSGVGTFSRGDDGGTVLSHDLGVVSINTEFDAIVSGSQCSVALKFSTFTSGEVELFILGEKVSLVC